MSIFEYDEEKHLKSLREESREDGRTEGRAQGFAEGHAKGRTEELISLICRKLKKQKTPETIADELEEENLDYIKEICDIANEFAPEYDIDKIYEKYTAGK